MQKEHVMYALSGLAVEVYSQGLTDFSEILVEMADKDVICDRLAELLNESDQDDLVQALIEQRLFRK